MVIRDNKWLKELMYELWDSNFADVARPNIVVTQFGKYSKRQLGSIRMAHSRSRIRSLLKSYKEEVDAADDKSVSIITMTKYFQSELIPEVVVKLVMAHEMVHYTHGFNSPLKQLYKNPHQGNIVNKELISRGLGDELEQQEKWIKENWLKFLRKYKK